MPAQPRSTRHGHQHVPGSAEQWKQADVGPGRTHSPIPTPVLCKTNQQPIPAWFVLRHILCTPSKQPKVCGLSGHLAGTSGLLRGSKSRITPGDQGASMDSLSSAPSVLPCPERLWDRQNLPSLTTVLLTHSLCTRTAQEGDAFSLLNPSAEVVQAHRGS